MKKPDRAEARGASVQNLVATAIVNVASGFEKASNKRHQGTILINVTAINLLLVCLLFRQTPIRSIFHCWPNHQASLSPTLAWLNNRDFGLTLLIIASLFTVLCLLYYYNRIRTAAARIRVSMPMPFNSALGMSYIIHLVLGSGLLIIALMSPTPERSPANSSPHEFVLQTTRADNWKKPEYSSIPSETECLIYDQRDTTNKTAETSKSELSVMCHSSTRTSFRDHIDETRRTNNGLENLLGAPMAVASTEATSSFENFGGKNIVSEFNKNRKRTDKNGSTIEFPSAAINRGPFRMRAAAGRRHHNRKILSKYRSYKR